MVQAGIFEQCFSWAKFGRNWLSLLRGFDNPRLSIMDGRCARRATDGQTVNNCLRSLSSVGKGKQMPKTAKKTATVRRSKSPLKALHSVNFAEFKDGNITVT